jgi:phosphoribosyl 1,2-cyclic phosphate phosphodiesterase
MGIPVIGCHCSVCQSDSPCNKRMRPSGLITIDNKKFLIDCGPDFRMQALEHHIDRLDGLILTHAHHDHTAGIDELRALYLRQKIPLPCLLSRDTAEEIRNRYYYIFKNPEKEQLLPRIDLQLLDGPRGLVKFQGINIRFLSYEQAGMQVNGFRFGDFAYISDIRHYPDTIFDDLKGIKTLVISALRFERTPFHLGIDDAVEIAKRIGSEHTWLTHISHELDHEATNAYLPANVRMSYDGLELTFDTN